MFDCAGDLYAVVRVISSGKTQQVGIVAHRIQGLIADLSSSDVVLLIQSTCRLFVFVKGSYLKSISKTEAMWKILGNRRIRTVEIEFGLSTNEPNFDAVLTGTRTQPILNNVSFVKISRSLILLRENP